MISGEGFRGERKDISSLPPFFLPSGGILKVMSLIGNGKVMLFVAFFLYLHPFTSIRTTEQEKDERSHNN